jgi:hypothetical protein
VTAPWGTPAAEYLAAQFCAHFIAPRCLFRRKRPKAVIVHGLVARSVLRHYFEVVPPLRGAVYLRVEWLAAADINY